MPLALGTYALDLPSYYRAGSTLPYDTVSKGVKFARKDMPLRFSRALETDILLGEIHVELDALMHRCACGRRLVADVELGDATAALDSFAQRLLAGRGEAISFATNPDGPVGKGAVLDDVGESVYEVLNLLIVTAKLEAKEGDDVVPEADVGVRVEGRRKAGRIQLNHHRHVRFRRRKRE